MSKNITLVMVPTQVQELRDELAKYHVGLLLQIAGEHDFYSCLGTIAAYCDIALEGVYSAEDIVGICEKLVGRLQKKRVITVTTSESTSKLIN